MQQVNSHLDARAARKWGVRSDAHLSKEAIESARSQLKPAANVFPDSISRTVQDALSTSLERVLTARDRGQLNNLEAATGVEMLREMAEGVSNVSASKGWLLGVKNPSDNVTLARYHVGRGDVYSVTTRREADNFGQARIAIKQIADDGISIPKDQQMHLRIDHCERFGPAVDVQFGWGELNEKIHGVEVDASGEPIVSQFGSRVPKHHFSDGLDPQLAEPKEFAALVDGFVAGSFPGLTPAQT